MQTPARYILLLLIIFITGAARSQPAVPSLTELIDSALANDYRLMNQQLDISATTLDKQQLKDAYLPRFKINGAEEYTLTAIALRTNEINIAPLNIHLDRSTNRFTLSSDRLRVGLEASSLIYSGGKVPLLKKAVDEKLKAQEFLTEKQKQDIISDVVATFDQLALLRQVRNVLDESERRLGEHLRIADKSFSYGLITKYEREKIVVAKAQLVSRIVEFEGRKTVVLEKLHWLTHIPIERLMLINHDLALMQTSQQNLSINNRPELKALSAIIVAEEFKVRAEKTWFTPKVEALGSLGYLGSFFGHLKSSKPVLPNGPKLSTYLRPLQIAPAASIGIAFSWTLFDGHDGRRNIARARLNVQKAANDKSDLIQQLELYLTKSRTDYDVSLTQVLTQTEQVKISGNALDQATKEYRTGLIRSSELIDAEEDLRQAELSLLQAIYNQRRAAVDLLKATGSLNISSLR